jgi:hypothetical protein
MRFFHQLMAVVLVTLVAVLGWDLSQRHIARGNKQTIIYAGMFGPGEPMQVLYSGPSPQLEPEHPFGPDAYAHYAALMQAWPDLASNVRDAYQRAFQRKLPATQDGVATDGSGVPTGKRPPASQGAGNGSPSPAGNDSPAADGEGAAPGPAPREAGTRAPATFDTLPLVDQYRQLDRRYVEQLVGALGTRDRANRLRLFRLFADLHPQHDARLIKIFQRLHPAYRIGLFEDFKRREPQYDIEERWDGRWVLSANRPRFLTGTDVPDLISGSLLELRILYRENLALPLDQPIPDAQDPLWRTKGILYGPLYNNPDIAIRDTFNPVAAEASRYTITEADVTRNHHPYPAGTRITYLWPSIVHAQVIFYNKAHFRAIGRDPDAVPETVDEFEDVCRQLQKAGFEPIAQDGIVYVENWWFELASRMMGYETLLSTCSGGLPRFAGPQGDPRYLQIARRLRRWRDQDFWMKQFSASKWPGAQRDFGTGKCTFLFTGTWLPAEIERTRSYDPAVFDLSCFLYPAYPGGPGNQQRISAGAQGHAITRQGRNHEGAARLLNYLSAYGAELESTELHYISAHKGIPFPAEMKRLEPVFARAGPGDVITDGIPGDLPLFYKFVLAETFPKFFLVRSDNISPEEFVEVLERKSQEHYQRYGKGT